MVIFSVLSSVFLIIGIFLIMGFTIEGIVNDIISFITPNETIYDKSRTIRKNRKHNGIYVRLMNFKTALEVTGKSKQFTKVCFASLILFTIGTIISIVINNLFLLPVLGISLALIPFFYTSSTLSYYEKHIKEELETTLSIITTSYIRNDDIVMSVRENLKYIKPPLRQVFTNFETEATTISQSIKQSLINLKDKVDNEVFREWCETLVQCQDDRTLKDTLLPIVTKLTDVRIVNNELKTMLASARNEYFVMAALVLGNIPLLYLLNKDWFNTLIYTIQGKATLGLCGVVLLVTLLLMLKFTKPIEYKR